MIILFDRHGESIIETPASGYDLADAYVMVDVPAEVVERFNEARAEYDEAKHELHSALAFASWRNRFCAGWAALAIILANPVMRNLRTTAGYTR